MLDVVIGGVRLRISLLFPAVLIVLLYSDPTGMPTWCVLASLLHELGHMLALLLLRGRLSSLHIGFFGMRMVLDRRYPLSYTAEALVALAGPLINVLMAIGLWLLTDQGPLLWIHLCLAGFNLLPIEPLDGGRALFQLWAYRCGEDRAWTYITRTSVVALFFVGFLGAWLWIVSGYNFTLAALCVYLAALVMLRMQKT